jgi:hypothetical protein
MSSALKKLNETLGFKSNEVFLYGFLQNTFVIIHEDEDNKICVSIKFPTELDESDMEKIKSWEKDGYAKKIEKNSDDTSSVEISFKSSNKDKIKEVIEDISGYYIGKYPEAKITCYGKDCTEETNIDIYELNGVPIPMCEKCAKELEKDLEKANIEEEAAPGNYLRGFLGAALFSIPGILVSFLFIMLGKIAAIAGFVYYYLALKGYSWAKGKFDKIGVLIVSVTSLLFVVVGTYLSTIADIVIEMRKTDEFKDAPLSDVIQFAFSFAQIPEVKDDIQKNIYLALFVCGICIVLYAFQAFKAAGQKLTIKKG